MYEHVVVAGTFDRLHKGHQAILDKAFQIGKKVHICVTTDSFVVQKTLAELIYPYAKRVKDVSDYISQKGYHNPFMITTLEDIYGISIVDPTIDAIVISPQSRENAVKVNLKRHEIGMNPLEFIEIDPIQDGNNKMISSQRIRYGEIDRWGVPFLIHFNEDKPLTMPEDLREELQKPLGRLFAGDQGDHSKAMIQIKAYLHEYKPVITIAVGDIVTASMEAAGITPDVAVIDGQTQRQPIAQGVVPSKTFINPRGTLYKDTVDALYKKIHSYLLTHKHVSMYVQGEEDLLALPSIVFSPLHSLIMYGMANQGVVIVEVTEESKEWARVMIDKFLK